MSPDKLVQTSALAREIRLQTEALECGQDYSSFQWNPSRDAAEAATRLLTLLKVLAPDPGYTVPTASDLKGGAPDEEADFFDEDAYLYANPDVAAAVDAGLAESGRDHWLKCGRAELRAGGPLEPLPERSRFLQ